MYILESDRQYRESQAIQHFVRSPHLDMVLCDYGLSRFAWILLEVDSSVLVSGIQGDVDIVAGGLTVADEERADACLEETRNKYPQWPRESIIEYALRVLAQDRQIIWPPAADDVIGLEFKCSYLSKGKIRSAKTSPQKLREIQKRINRMNSMGFTKSGLVDIVATEPSGDFWEGLGNMDRAAQAAKPVLQDRIPEYSRAGHHAWIIGSVAGGDESCRGAGTLLSLKNPQSRADPESTAASVAADQIELRSNIQTLLTGLPRPRYFPFVATYSKKDKRADILTP